MQGSTTSRYSGTPLFRKLGIKEGMRILVIGGDQKYTAFFEEWPGEGALVEISSEKEAGVLSEKAAKFDFIHIFATTFESLEGGLVFARKNITQKGMIWVSWPKKSSELESEIGKFDVMQAGQAIGFVDVKVASINETWSGHKFVIPVKDRSI